MNITVFALPLTRELSDEEAELLWGSLTYERYQRLKRTREEKHRQILCAYGLLHYAVVQLLGVKELPTIEVADSGKPFFKDYPNLYFSLTHGETGVAVALWQESVGIDLEANREAAPTLLRHYKVQSQDAFWRMWVSHEAIVKYHGLPAAPLLHWDQTLEEHVSVTFLDTLPDCTMAIAVRETNVPVQATAVTLEQLLMVLAAL